MMKTAVNRIQAAAVALLLLVPIGLSAGTVSYSYDALHRLTAVSYPDGDGIGDACDSSIPCACGSASGVATSIAPASGLCASGSARAVSTASGSHTWSCSTSDGDAPCVAPGLASPGTRGSAGVAMASLSGEGCVLSSAEIVSAPAGLPAGPRCPLAHWISP